MRLWLHCHSFWGACGFATRASRTIGLACCMGGIMPGDCIGMPAGGAGGIIGCAAGCMGDAKLIGLALAEGGAGAPIAPPMGCGAVENPSRPANAL